MSECTKPCELRQRVLDRYNGVNRNDGENDYTVALKQENSDLRAKLEAAERKIRTREKIIALKKAMLSKAYQDSEEIFQQCLKLVAEKQALHDKAYEHFFARFKVEKERDDLQRQVSEQSATIAQMRGALEFYADDTNRLSYPGAISEYGNDDGETAKKALAALTTSGDNRYVRIEEAAKVLLSEVRQFSPRQSQTTIDAADKLATALGEGEKHE